MPKISVIIPVYNVEPYVEKCVRSVLNQTFTDLEVICVENGSTDGSLAVLDKLARDDGRIKIFAEQKLGLGYSRNKGLKEAHGDYILFVDSDDFIAPSLCAFLYEHAQTEGLDVASCEFYEYRQASGCAVKTPYRSALRYKREISFAGGDTYTDFANFAFASPFAWGKLYRREIIERKQIRFPVGAVEDVPFVVSCLMQCKHAKRFEQYLYYYRVGRPGNISGKAERMLLDGIKNFGVLEENLKQYGLFEEVKEVFWFNKMVLLIGDERVFAGRLGNVSLETVQQAYDLIHQAVLELPPGLFASRNAWFRWKVAQLQKALVENNLKFPYRLRKLRNMLMIFLSPYFNLRYKWKKIICTLQRI